ncbi:MAG TPA: TrkA family potassium uptake protein [Firmicutes bacterium]|nr:TrkA family potassium uptake protein [Candidatus Fermentithermobacillaceae bacterium]
MTKQCLVIGIGRFGSSVAETLTELGAEVLAVDKVEERVRAIAPRVTQAIVADATDETVLREIGVRNFDVVICSMGESLEASLLVTMLLKELGAKRVIVKAANEIHGRILARIGADTVVYPERDMGKRLAYSLLSGSIIDSIELSSDYRVVEVVVSGGLVGKTLRGLNLRNKIGVNVMAIKRGNYVNVAPDPDHPLEEGDILVVVGPNSGVARLNQIVERG